MFFGNGGGGQGGGGGAMGGMSGGGWIMPAMAAGSNRFSKIEEQQMARKARARSAEEMRWSPWTGVAHEALPDEPAGPVATTQQNIAMFMGQNQANKDRNDRESLRQQNAAMETRRMDQQDRRLNMMESDFGGGYNSQSGGMQQTNTSRGYGGANLGVDTSMNYGYNGPYSGWSLPRR